MVGLCGKTNQTVYHMLRFVQSPGRSSITKLKMILFYRYRRFPVKKFMIMTNSGVEVPDLVFGIRKFHMRPY